MKLFKNEKVDTVNEKINEIEAKQSAIQNELSELNEALQTVIEGFAIGVNSDYEVDQAKAVVEAKAKEIEALETLKGQIQAVKRKVATDAIPLIKEMRQKKIQEVQAEYDKAVQDVHKARFEFMSKLAHVGTLKAKINPANIEVNQALVEVGLQPETYGETIQERIVVPNGYTSEIDALGFKEATLKRIYNGEKALLDAFNPKRGEK